MAEQYFTSDPSVEHDIQTIKFDLADVLLTLETDAGVFSKSRVDYGSVVLLKAIFSHDLNLPAGKILDLGAGYGPIGLTLAKRFSERIVDMVDVNHRALNLAQKNAQLNQVENIEIFESDVYDQVKDQYALIVTNPPIRAGKQVVNEIHEKSFEHLVTGGSIVTVLQKKQGAPSAKKLLEATFGNVEVLARDKGYYILRSVKR